MAFFRAVCAAAVLAVLVALVNAQGSGDTTTTTTSTTSTTTTAYPGPFYSVFVFQRIYNMSDWVYSYETRENVLWTMDDNMPAGYFRDFGVAGYGRVKKAFYDAATGTNRTDQFVTWALDFFPGQAAAEQFISDFNAITNWVWSGPLTGKNVTTYVISRALLQNDSDLYSNRGVVNCGPDYPFLKLGGSPCEQNHRCAENNFKGQFCCSYASYYCEKILQFIPDDPACNRAVHNEKFFFNCQMPLFYELHDVMIWPKVNMNYYFSGTQYLAMVANLTTWQQENIDIIATSLGLYEALVYLVSLSNGGTIPSNIWNSSTNDGASNSGSSSSSAPSTTAVVLLAVGAVILVAVVAFSVGKRMNRNTRQEAVAYEQNDAALAAKAPVKPIVNDWAETDA